MVRWAALASAPPTCAWARTWAATRRTPPSIAATFAPALGAAAGRGLPRPSSRRASPRPPCQLAARALRAGRDRLTFLDDEVSRLFATDAAPMTASAAGSAGAPERARPAAAGARTCRACGSRTDRDRPGAGEGARRRWRPWRRCARIRFVSTRSRTRGPSLAVWETVHVPDPDLSRRVGGARVARLATTTRTGRGAPRAFDLLRAGRGHPLQRG